jgi:transcriptional regulator with XRE-family HTH domain
MTASARAQPAPKAAWKHVFFIFNLSLTNINASLIEYVFNYTSLFDGRQGVFSPQICLYDVMTNLRTLLAANMRERRHFLSLSQLKLAERMNVGPTYIAAIESERKFPSVAMLERIAAALEVDTPELFSVQVMTKQSITELHRGILKDVEKAVAARLCALDAKA